MKIAFFGTPDFAAVSLDFLLKNRKKIILAVTQPDRPKGRGRKMDYTPVKKVALKNSVPVLQPESPKSVDFIEKLKEISPDLILVISYGHILREELLLIPQLECINLHPSLLPKYRGAAPINWAIIKGENETGVTTMFMTKRMDAGDIIEQRHVGIEKDEIASELETKLAEEGSKLLLSTLDLVEKGKEKRTPQNESGATYAPKLDLEMCRIDWRQDAESISNLIRGLAYTPGAYTYFRGRRAKLLRSEFKKGETVEEMGSIIVKKGLSVAAKGGVVIVKEIQVEGKKIMNAVDFINGYKPKHGEKFE